MIRTYKRLIKNSYPKIDENVFICSSFSFKFGNENWKNIRSEGAIFEMSYPDWVEFKVIYCSKKSFVNYEHFFSNFPACIGFGHFLAFHFFSFFWIMFFSEWIYVLHKLCRFLLSTGWLNISYLVVGKTEKKRDTNLY